MPCFGIELSNARPIAQRQGKARTAVRLREPQRLGKPQSLQINARNHVDWRVRAQQLTSCSSQFRRVHSHPLQGRVPKKCRVADLEGVAQRRASVGVRSRRDEQLSERALPPSAPPARRPTKIPQLPPTARTDLQVARRDNQQTLAHRGLQSLFIACKTRTSACTL